MSAAPKLSVIPTRPCVLFVDDDAGNRQAFQTTFRREMDVYVAKDIKEVWACLAAHHVHVVIADQRMPGTPGSQMLVQIKERYPNIKRMLITGYSDIEAVIDAVNKAGVVHYSAKPWNADEMTEAVLRAYGEVLAEEERTSYTEKLKQVNQQLEFALRQRLLS